MRFTLKTDNLVKGLAEAETNAARSVTSAMREVTDGLKGDLRADVIDAGLGQRLANTWRGKTYPEGGVSLEPASFVWSKAPNLIDAFDRGVTIKSSRGFWLAIPTPAAGVKLPFVSSALGDEQNLIASDLLGYGREPLPPGRDVISNEGDVVVPVDLRNFGHWLKLLMGAPASVDNSGVHTHTFISGALTLPSMAIEIGMPEVPSYGMNVGVRANSMKIQLQRSGLLNATMSLIAQGETKATSSAAGTPTEAVIERFSQFMGEIKRNGAALGHIVSAELTYANNLDKVEVIRPDGRIEDADPAMVAVTGNVTMRFADTVLLDQATSGGPCELSFGWAIDADKSLLFTIHSAFLPKPKTPIQGPGGIQAAFAWHAAKDPALHKTCTAVLVNDVTAY